MVTGNRAKHNKYCFKLRLFLFGFLIAILFNACAHKEDRATLLVTAILNDDVEKVNYLLEREESIQILINEDGDTPLNVSALAGHADLVKLLLSKGADIEARNVNGSTPLLQAARRGYPEIISLLLSEGANIEARDTEGYTPLLHAVDRGHYEAVSLLLSKGADKTAHTNDGTTALQFAERNGNEEIVSLLNGGR